MSAEEIIGLAERMGFTRSEALEMRVVDVVALIALDSELGCP